MSILWYKIYPTTKYNTVLWNERTCANETKSFLTSLTNISEKIKLSNLKRVFRELGFSFTWISRGVKNSLWPCFALGKPQYKIPFTIPLQVPHSYKQNVCHYKDQFRYFYSAMVSALDHSVDQVGSYCWFENMTFPDLTWYVWEASRQRSERK